jgi:hypothetical protein
MASYVWGERRTRSSERVLDPPSEAIVKDYTETYGLWSGPGALSSKSVLLKDIGPYFILLF